MKKFRIQLFIVLLIFSHLSTKGQQNNTLYFHHEIPQSTLLNPAIQDTCKLFIGIPVLSSIHFALGNTAFSYNTIIRNGQIDPDYAISKLHNIDYLFFEFHTNLLSVGYKYDDYYFTFNIAEKISFDFGFPKDLFLLPWEGTTQFINNPAKLDRLGINFTHLREYSISGSKKLNDNLQVGTRAKLLFGKSQVFNTRSKIRLDVDEDFYYLNLTSDLLINSSIPGLTLGSTVNDVSFDAGGLSPVSYLLNRKNWGLGFDVGGIYYDDVYNIKYHASITDLGYIRWKSDVNKFQQTNAFEYRGPQGTEITNYLTDIADSLANMYLQNEEDHSPYFYWLSPQIFLGATYQWKPKIGFGAMTRTRIYQKRVMPSFTLSANVKPFRFLSFTLSSSYLNNNFNNIGMGLSFRGKHSQFYLVTDNFSSGVWPLAARGFNLRFGYNMFFGCGRAECPKKLGCFWVKESMYKKYKMDQRKAGKDIDKKQKKKKRKCG